MDAALQVVVEMAETIWNRFRQDLDDMRPEEVDWRPLPQANNINVIVRHLAIEAEWHRAAIERGAPMPWEATDDLQREIDRVPLDFARNLDALEHAFAAFVDALRNSTLSSLQQRTEAAFQRWPRRSAHQLGFHQVTHLAMHWGQIRTIRNLYSKSRGEPARFIPDNPTFPQSAAPQQT